jgi:DNA-binding transcriptional ArsR family regulator
LRREGELSQRRRRHFWDFATPTNCTISDNHASDNSGMGGAGGGISTWVLTRKVFLTYVGGMVVTPDREPDVFGAISHPARRRMLDLLVEDDRSVNMIAGHFQMSRPAVSQHLRILLDAGLVTEQRHGRERRYHLVPARLGPVRDWIAHYERFWDDRLQRLQTQLSKQRTI